MTWLRIDDGMPDHPKVRGLTLSAKWAYVVALCYCAQYATDGDLPNDLVSKADMARLVDAGLVDNHGSSLHVHDYLTYNPSRSDIEKRRREDSERKRRGRTSESRGSPAGVQTESARPGPARPDPTPEPPKAKARAASSRPTEDQTYLAAKISDAWGLTNGHLGPAAIQKLNTEYGIEKVSSSLRLLHGFPPEEAISSAYAYLVEMCRADT